VKRTIGLGGALVLGLSTVLVGVAPALAAETATIHVPSDFVAKLGDTRTTGHYEVLGTGLRVWTAGSSSTDKVAEYVATKTSLADAGEPSLELTHTDGAIAPGFQLVVDFDGNGTVDGILVGEKTYGGDWWASNGSAQFVKDGAPSHDGGSGSANHGTLDGWRAKFPDAQVAAFGFSLGSGVKGDWTIDSIEFAGTSYTFAADVVLTSKDECKDGGWATSYPTTYKNQGECVSWFAQLSPKQLNKLKSH
jgi:hypothetical protein